MHNQHRSPDPTKIERATATSTVALFSLSLKIKTQLLKRLQRVIVLDGATQSTKHGVEGKRGSLEDGSEAFVLFLHSTQLVMWSSHYST